MMQQSPDLIPDEATGQASQSPPPSQPDAAPTDPAADPSQDQGNPNNLIPANADQQKVDGAASGGARAVGSVEDANQAAQDDNPANPQEVSPAEQAEYEQFVSRFIMFISDDGSNRHPANGPMKMSPSDAVLKMLNNPRIPLAQAIGVTTAHVAFIIVTSAKAQKITYQPDVLFHANFECCVMMYLLGLSAGIFNGVPPFKGVDDDGSYDFNEQEVRIIADAQMQAVRAFGTLEVQHGMISPDMQKDNLNFWHQQVQREVQKGVVSDDVIQKLVKSGKLRPQQPMSGTAGQAAPATQPAPAQAQSPAQPGTAGAMAQPDQSQGQPQDQSQQPAPPPAAAPPPDQSQPQPPPV